MSDLEQNSLPRQNQAAVSVGVTPSSISSLLPPAEQIAGTMQSIDQLAVWLENTGLSAAAIAQWKYNSLAATFPVLGKIAESAKSLIGTTQPMPEVGMTVTEIAQLLSSSCERKIKPADVNQALVELGLQIRKERERVWELTEAGSEYGQALLATSKTNDWSGPQVKWFKSVIPLLEDYFQNPAQNGKPDTQQVQATSETLESTKSDRARSTNSASEREFWFIEERVKHLGKKAYANQLLHIDMHVIDSYKERHGKPPGKQPFKRSQATAIPVADEDLLDAAISKVISRTQGTATKKS